MKKYSIKKYRNKRRNVKKYKKSQKNGKTRRYKVSKNINRHYSLRKGKGIRRHMSGGVYNFRTDRFAFNLDPDKLKNYVNSKYGLKNPSLNDQLTDRHKFTRLERVAYGKVAITNTSLGFYFRKDNRYEQISVFACYRYEALICYVIARCISPRSCEKNFNNYIPGGYHDRPTDGMEEKILFVDCREVKKKEFANLITENQKTAFDDFVKTEARNKGNIVEVMKMEILDPNGGYHLFEFRTLNTDLNRSTNDPGDTYRVIILPLGKDAIEVITSSEEPPLYEGGNGYQKLVKFFDDQADKKNPIREGDQRYATQNIAFPIAAGDGAGAGALVGSLVLGF